jgi:hypothetical protein
MDMISVWSIEATQSRFIKSWHTILFFDTNPSSHTLLVIVFDLLHFRDQIGLIDHFGGGAPAGDHQFKVIWF